jgi:hypothetical protein
MQRVHTLQDAATNEKAAPLAQLRAEHCSSAKACELQEVCAQGYSLYEHAQKTTHAVRDAMNAGNSNALLAQQLLDTNEAELERAKMLMDQCVVALGQAARDLRL